MVYLTWWIGTVCCVLVLVHVRINNLSDTVKFQKLQIDGLNKNLLHLWDEVNNNRKDLQKGIDAAAGSSLMKLPKKIRVQIECSGYFYLGA